LEEQLSNFSCNFGWWVGSSGGSKELCIKWGM